MSTGSAPAPESDEARAWAWRKAALTAVCDVAAPWPHGSILRATAYPDYYEYNVLTVEDDAELTVGDLIGVADEALAGCRHRRLEFAGAGVGEPLRSEFEARGWLTQRLVWMRHDDAWPPCREVRVEAVGYDSAEVLRRRWHREDSPELDPAGIFRQAREIALRHGTQTFVLSDGASPIAFVELARSGSDAEIARAYVVGERRGQGLGAALIRGAAQAAGDVRDLWICADDEDRAKQLYTRLGFRPALATIEFLLLP